VPGMFFNKNTNNPNVWTYEPDTSTPYSRQYGYHTVNARVTWQATPRHKFTLSEQDQAFCECGNAVSSTTAPEAGQERRWPTMHSVVGDWSAPLTSRLLVVNEDTEITNFGEHLIRRTVEELFYELVAPPRLLAGAHIPGIGLADNLEMASVPQLPSITEAIRSVARAEP